MKNTTVTVKYFHSAVSFIHMQKVLNNVIFTGVEQ